METLTFCRRSSLVHTKRAGRHPLIIGKARVVKPPLWNERVRQVKVPWVVLNHLLPDAQDGLSRKLVSWELLLFVFLSSSLFPIFPTRHSLVSVLGLLTLQERSSHKYNLPQSVPRAESPTELAHTCEAPRPGPPAYTGAAARYGC